MNTPSLVFKAAEKKETARERGRDREARKREHHQKFNVSSALPQAS